MWRPRTDLPSRPTQRQTAVKAQHHKQWHAAAPTILIASSDILTSQVVPRLPLHRCPPIFPTLPSVTVQVPHGLSGTQGNTHIRAALAEVSSTKRYWDS